MVESPLNHHHLGGHIIGSHFPSIEDSQILRFCGTSCTSEFVCQRFFRWSPRTTASRICQCQIAGAPKNTHDRFPAQKGIAFWMRNGTPGYFQGPKSRWRVKYYSIWPKWLVDGPQIFCILSWNLKVMAKLSEMVDRCKSAVGEYMGIGIPGSSFCV